MAHCEEKRSPPMQWSKVLRIRRRDESLRLSPPVPRGLERKTPSQDMHILGDLIAGNVTVSVLINVVHHDVTLFHALNECRPERWLGEPKETMSMRAAFLPFIIGARACHGRDIMMMEQQILMTTLAYRYDFALSSLDWALEWDKAFNLWPAQVQLKIWRRDF